MTIFDFRSSSPFLPEWLTLCTYYPTSAAPSYTPASQTIFGRRVDEHQTKIIKGFSAKYNCDRLVYYEEFTSIVEAIHREKQLKRYRREWKVNLIERMNAEWKDLSEG